MGENGYDLILEHSRTDVEHQKHCLELILDPQIDAVTYFVNDLSSHLEYLKLAAKTSTHVVALTSLSEEPTPFTFDAVAWTSLVVSSLL